MKLSEYKEKKMKDNDFYNAYSDIQKEINEIRLTIDEEESHSENTIEI